MQHPNLDRLNSLIRKSNLGLPEFRSHVDSSGRNLKWLKKVVVSNPKASNELKELLNMPQAELLRSTAVTA